MAETIAAWVLRGVSLLAILYGLLAFLDGLTVEFVLRGRKEATLRFGIRVLQGLPLLGAAVAIWFLAGAWQRNMKPDSAILIGAAAVVTFGLALCYRRWRPDLVPANRPRLVEVLTVFPVMVGIMAGVDLLVPLLDPDYRSWPVSLPFDALAFVFVLYIVFAFAQMRSKPKP